MIVAFLVLVMMVALDVMDVAAAGVVVVAVFPWMMMLMIVLSLDLEVNDSDVHQEVSQIAVVVVVSLDASLCDVVMNDSMSSVDLSKMKFVNIDSWCLSLFLWHPTYLLQQPLPFLVHGHIRQFLYPVRSPLPSHQLPSNICN